MRGDLGVTLIEVLIGITLLAMLGTLVAGGTRIGGRAWSSVEHRTSDSDDIVLLQSLLRRTVLRAAPAFASADPADRTVAFVGEPDSMTLLAPEPGTGFAGPWIGQQFDLSRQRASHALTFTLADGRPIVLLDRIATLRFAYFGPVQPNAVPEWQDRWTGRDRLPDRVRIRILRDGARLAPWPELVVATRMTANATCVFSPFVTGCRRMRR